MNILREYLKYANFLLQTYMNANVSKIVEFMLHCDVFYGSPLCKVLPFTILAFSGYVYLVKVHNRRNVAHKGPSSH